MKHNALASTMIGVGICAVTVACRDPSGVAGLRPTFEASPDTVVAGDTVEVLFTLRNRTPYGRTIRSSWGCLFFLQTLRDDEPVPWKGTDYACAAAITDFTIAPGDSLHYVHKLVAAEAGSPAAAVLPAGTYRIRTRMNADLPDLETEVTVKAAGQLKSRAGSSTAAR